MASRRQERLNDPADQDGDFASRMDLDKDSLQPGMPGMKDFFEAERQGVHPFDSIKNSYDRERDGTPWEDKAYEEARESELHRRELLGKLFGEQLTPRQYEMIAGMYREDDFGSKYMRDMQN